MGNSSKALTNSETSEASRPGRMGWVWIAAPFVLIGAVACIAVVAVADRKGGGLAILALLILPPALIATVLALRKGFALLNQLRGRMTWWHFLWLVVFLSALVFRIRGAQDIQENPLDAWAAYRIVLEFIAGSVLFMRLALRRTSWLGSLFRGYVGVLACFAIVELASAVWSVFPSWTLYKSCEYLMDIALLAAILATIRSIEEFKGVFDWTWALYGLLVLSAWIGIVVDPKDALYSAGFKIGLIGVRLDGVMPHVSANDLGTFAGILALLALCRILPVDGEKRDRLWYGFLFSISIATMVLAQTRTAFAGLLFGIFLILFFSRRFALSAVLSFFVMPLLLLTSLGGLIWSFLERGDTEVQMQTLSSRTVWWSFALKKFMERPMTGLGAYAGGRFAVLAQLGQSKTSTMHSDFLEVLVGTGIWGMIPFLLALLLTWWFLARFLRRSDFMGTEQQLAYEALAILGLLTFRSFFGTGLCWHPPLHYLAILGLAEFLRRRRLDELPSSQRIPGTSHASLETAVVGGDS